LADADGGDGGGDVGHCVVDCETCVERRRSSVLWKRVDAMLLEVHVDG